MKQLDQFKSALTRDDLRTEAVLAAYSDWITYRAERKLPLTDVAIRRNARLAERLGPDGFVSAIHTAIDRGWRGLFGAKDVREVQPHGKVPVDDIEWR